MQCFPGKIKREWRNRLFQRNSVAGSQDAVLHLQGVIGLLDLLGQSPAQFAPGFGLGKRVLFKKDFCCQMALQIANPLGYWRGPGDKSPDGVSRGAST
jgi:hypothetical protein